MLQSEHQEPGMPGRNRISMLKNSTGFLLSIDWMLWIPVLILSVVGILFIYSSGLNVEGEPHHSSLFPAFARQILWVVLGIAISIFFAIIPWRDLSLYSVYAMPVLLLLMLITIFLPAHSGTYSWIRIGPLSLQPSELTKPFFIMAAAFLLERFRSRIHRPLPLIGAIGIAMIPVFITVMQRDMGTASVYLPVFFVMLLMAGADRKVLLGLLLFFILVYSFTVGASWSFLTGRETVFSILLTHNTSRITISILLSMVMLLSTTGALIYRKSYYLRILYFSSIILIAYLTSFATIPTENSSGLLGRYQIERLVYPIDNDLKLSTSYNIEQARTAIGAGGWSGKGYLRGNLSHRRFVPEQPTDFIFSILGEEWGWFGSVFVLLLYALFLIRILVIMLRTTELSALLILCGLFTLYFYHMTVNIGMNIGMIPVIGIPLMFVSYGGTAIWTAFIGIGIIQNISRSN